MTMKRSELIKVGATALSEDDPYGNDWTPEATVVVDAILPLLGNEDALFRVHNDAPETSKAIVEKIREGTLQDDVLALFVNLHRAGGIGATDDDIEVSLKRSHQSVSGARNTLVRKGYLVDSGERRLNRYGNLAIRWCYTGREIVR